MTVFGGVTAMVTFAISAVPSAGLAQAELQGLEEQLGPVQIDLREVDGLRYLAARDIAPECSAKQEALDKETAEAAAQCVLQARRGLLGARLDPPWGLDRVTEPDEMGFQVVRIGQRHSGLPIRGSEVVLTFRHGRAISFMGQLFTADQIGEVAVEVADMQDVLTSAEKALDERLVPVGRYFDPSCGCVVSDLQSESSTETVYAFDEREGRVLRKWSTQDDLNLVPMTAVVRDYPDTFESSNNQTVSLMLDWDANGAHGLAKACKDWGSDADDGEPKAVRATGGASDSSQVSCDNIDPNSTHINSSNSMPMNAYFWAHDLSSFAHHWRAAYQNNFNWHEYDSENLKIVLPNSNVCSPGSFACARQSFNIWGTHEFRMILPLSNGSPMSLGTIAHEYGHIIHYMYGRAESGFTRNVIEEGFADQNILRYAMFRDRERSNRPHDSMFTAQYTDDFWGQPWDHRISEYYSNGEALPSPMNPADDWAAMTWSPWNSSSPCVRQDDTMNDVYRCGSLVGTIYWTLAHNELRVGYSGLPAGTQILDTSPYRFVPDFLAAYAITYALVGMPKSGDLNDFFRRVSEIYYAWSLDGTVSTAEVHRVNQALAVHCVGWSAGTCTDYHRTAWQSRPVLLTAKATFDTGHAEHFLRAESMSRGGSPLNPSFGTSDGLGYMRLDSSGDEICTTVNFPSNGTYKFSAASRVAHGSADSVYVRIGASGWRTWHLEPVYNSWRWHHNGPSINAAAGAQTVCLRFREPVDLDAILIRRQ